MQARELVTSGAFEPETLKAMGDAFDQAWKDVAGNFGNDELEKARTKLATAVLTVTKDGNKDAQALKTAALEYMAQNYRQRELTTHRD
jgi:hypothetical protein